MVQEKKVAASKQLWCELEKKIEVLRKVLEDKEGEIKDIKDQLRQAKEDVKYEYLILMPS